MSLFARARTPSLPGEKLLRKVFNGLVGLLSAIALNTYLLIQVMGGKKVVVFQVHAASQLPHIESLILALSQHPKIVSIVLSAPKELGKTRDILGNTQINVWSYDTTLFLIFWDIVIAVDQRMRLPLFNLRQGHRICVFHGQPTKGNVYSGFNHKQFDDLFFYGPMMRDYYHRMKSLNEDWQDVATWEIGQPKSDTLFSAQPSGEVDSHKGSAKSQAYESLSIAAEAKTILYAPSFEATSSLATQGEAVIQSLQLDSSHLIVKPHPAFFRTVDERDHTYDGSPHSAEWQDRALELEQLGNVTFATRHQIDTALALAAADLLVTDHSGIAFDAILLDIPVVFIDCPEFFSDYLPKTYGIDGAQAKDDIACNAGRAAGVVVESCEQLRKIAMEELENPLRHQQARREVREQLIFNEGKATLAASTQILDFLNLNHD